MKTEKRYRHFPVEFRATGKTIIGKIPYGTKSLDLGGFTEILKPACFRESLKNGGRIMAFWNHNSGMPLGNSANGTLKIQDKADGLHFTITPPETSWAKDALESIRSGVIEGCSFGFNVKQDEWRVKSEERIREIVEADIFEISPVSQPAYPSTSVSVRRLNHMNLREMYQERQQIVTEQRRMLDEVGEHRWAADDREKYDRLEEKLNEVCDKIDDAERREKLALNEAVYGGGQRLAIEKCDDDRKYRIGDPKSIEYRAWDKILRGHYATLTADEHRALQVESDISGGFTAPDFFTQQLIKERDRRVFMRQICKVITFDTGTSINAPVLDNDPASPDWTGELLIGDEDSTMDFEGRKLSPHPLAKYIKVSRDLIDLSAIDIPALVRDRLAYKNAVTEEDKFLNGNSANMPLGVFVAHDSGITTSRDVSTSNTTTALKADNIIETFYTLEPQYQQDAVFILHRDVLKAVRKLKSGEGEYLWTQGLAGNPNTILDKRYYLSEYAPNTFTSGKYMFVVGAFGEGYWIAQNIRLRIDVLTELFAATNQYGYVSRVRVDGMPVQEKCFARSKLA